ncbi:PRA1 (Prenylated rab acceptor) family protein [Striga asiatica]|uniref:PRA1 family protein n=1 Tax=Striga asiatica TaxID=4170 RepID=A0A5A7QS00_STRAF|nr:PRA1 (Prenylated rab acceptor) family protein [Striga asiatica]
MTSYGTIPASSSPSGAAANLEYISRAKDRIKAGLGTRRPWREMLDRRGLGLPRSAREAAARVRKNLTYFRMNYAVVVLGVLFLSLLWHPISLVVLVAMMAAWLFLYFLRDEPLEVFGRLVTDRVVLVALAVATVVVLLLTHATANVLAALLVGVGAVLVHGAVRRTDDLVADEEAEGGLRRKSAGGPLSS